MKRVYEMRTILDAISDTGRNEKPMFTFQEASLMLDECGDRRVVGGIEILAWHCIDVNWESDFVAMAKFIMSETKGRFSFGQQMIKFEDDKDAAMFALWFQR